MGWLVSLGGFSSSVDFLSFSSLLCEVTKGMDWELGAGLVRPV